MNEAENVVSVNRYNPYPNYMESGIMYYGKIPDHWKIRKLKYISKVRFSTVDKIKSETEEPVLLCNYVDVYHNDYITKNISFMEGTASKFEISKFSLKQNQIIVTKDSETWNDIAIPAYVLETLNGVVCGYHLALIVPDESIIDGKYLFRCFNSSNTNYQFTIAANGITRYGLGKYWLDNSLFIIPPLSEQRAIAAFLDRETAKIDALIAKKKRLIELLEEKRNALISQAVTKGLNPETPMKDSGVEWYGDIPKKWKIIKIKSLAGNETSIVQTGPFGAQLHASDYIDEGVPLILIKNVKDLFIDDTDIPKVSQKDANRLSMYRLEVGDIVFSRVGSIGRIALVMEREKGWLISGQMLRLRIRSPRLHGNYSVYALISQEITRYIELTSVGSTRDSINTYILRNLPLPLPPIEEQIAIATYIKEETFKINSSIGKISFAIKKLIEYRAALISSAVTGKIDVRGLVSEENEVDYGL